MYSYVELTLWLLKLGMVLSSMSIIKLTFKHTFLYFYLDVDISSLHLSYSFSFSVLKNFNISLSY